MHQGVFAALVRDATVRPPNGSTAATARFDTRQWRADSRHIFFCAVLWRSRGRLRHHNHQNGVSSIRLCTIYVERRREERAVAWSTSIGGTVIRTFQVESILCRVCVLLLSSQLVWRQTTSGQWRATRDTCTPPPLLVGRPRQGRGRSRFTAYSVVLHAKELLSTHTT